MGALLPARCQPPFDAVLAGQLRARRTHHSVLQPPITDKALKDLLDIHLIIHPIRYSPRLLTFLLRQHLLLLLLHNLLEETLLHLLPLLAHLLLRHHHRQAIFLRDRVVDPLPLSGVSLILAALSVLLYDLAAEVTQSFD